MQFVYNKQNKIYILVVQIYIFVLRITEITVFRECNVETPLASLTLSSSLTEGAIGKEVKYSVTVGL